MQTENTTSEFAPKPKEGEPWDVAIVGSGPAGFTAAIYSTRGAASTIIFGGEKWGGQLMLTTTVDNWPGMPGIQGPELMQKMKDHATMFGGQFMPLMVEGVDLSRRPFTLSTSDKKNYLAKSVIITTGSETRWLGIPGEDKLRGKGVSSCAPCDAPFFKGKNVAVVGGGDSAMEEALVLTKHASAVTMIHRKAEFRASKLMQAKIMALQKQGRIKIVWNTEVKEFLGGNTLEKIKVLNNKTNQESEMQFDGVFVAVGHIPSTKIFQGKIELDEKGYVKRVPKNGFQTTTSVDGIFVAGDVHDYHYKQAITAAGYGCQAAMDALRYLEESPS